MRVTLQARITLVVSLITLTALGIGTYFIKKYMENYILEQTSHRVLTIASTVAEDPEIIQAFNLSEPAQKIQPLAERIRKVTETSYVVVFNMNTIRYSHPVPERIGQHFRVIEIAGTAQLALQGLRSTSITFIFPVALILSQYSESSFLESSLCHVIDSLAACQNKSCT